jgi:hypothetical protein
MHWHEFQIPILVQISYSKNPSFDSLVGELEVIKEVHYYVSNDTMHDTLFVQHAFMMHWDHLKDQGYSPKFHLVWSDGCSKQFKFARAWYFVSQYPSLTISNNLSFGCEMIWNFFATGHGKGEVDGVGALLKREVCKEQIKPKD